MQMLFVAVLSKVYFLMMNPYVVFNFWTTLSYKASVILMTSVLQCYDRRLPKAMWISKDYHVPLATDPR